MAWLSAILWTTVVGSVILQAAAILWLYENRRFARRRRFEACPQSDQSERVAVVIPCRGAMPGLRAHLLSYLRQDYANYQLILVVTDPRDAAIPLIQNIIHENRFFSIQMVIASPHGQRGQRLTQILAGIQAAAQECRILAVGNSECAVKPTWLRWLVHALNQPHVGLATGGTWHVPRYQTWANRFLANWANLMAAFQGPGRQIYISPESWAVRAEDWERLGLAAALGVVLDERWVLSDAVRAAGLKIRFEPQCVVERTIALQPGQPWRDLTAQQVMSRTYARPFWGLALFVNSLSQLAFWGTWAWAVGALAGVVAGFWPAVLSHFALYGLGATRSVLKDHIGKMAVPSWRQLKATRQTDVYLWPLIEGWALLNAVITVSVNKIYLDQGKYLLSPNGTVRLLSLRPDLIADTNTSDSEGQDSTTRAA